MANLFVTTSSAAGNSGSGLALEKRFDLSKTVGETKQRLAMLVGVEPHCQQLSLYESNESTAKRILAELGPEHASLDSLGV
jgi:hypothetical protein